MSDTPTKEYLVCVHWDVVSTYKVCAASEKEARDKTVARLEQGELSYFDDDTESSDNIRVAVEGEVDEKGEWHFY